jgi:hypothetical protein
MPSRAVANPAFFEIYYLIFIIDELILKKVLVKSLLNEAKELTAIFVSSRKTIKNNK